MLPHGRENKEEVRLGSVNICSLRRYFKQQIALGNLTKYILVFLNYILCFLFVVFFFSFSFF